MVSSQFLGKALRSGLHGLDEHLVSSYLKGYDETRADAIAKITQGNPALAWALKNSPNPKAVIDAERSRLKAERAIVEMKASTAGEELRRLERLCDGVTDLEGWIASPLRLEAANESLLHKVTHQSILTPRVETSEPTIEIEDFTKAGCEAFLIQHDWAALLPDDVAGDIRLPYERCCFEFQMSGRRVCALFLCEDGEPQRMWIFVRVKGGWLWGDDYRPDGDGWFSVKSGEDMFCEVAKIVRAQIRAVAITLDAEVTVSEVVRAPYRLNAQRIKRGEIPVFDHHVISLARRAHASRLPSGEPPKRGVRLHFRRGHWRHFENHKTWIKWMLVGNPDLGFVTKDYAL